MAKPRWLPIAFCSGLLLSGCGDGNDSSGPAVSLTGPGVSPTEIVAGTPGVASRRAVISITELAAQAAFAPTRPRAPKAIHPPLPGPPRLPPAPGEAVAPLTSPAPPAAGPAPFSPAPSDSFAALPDNGRAIPPDTHGAVGPNHLMVTLNSEVRIQDRAGNTVSTVPLDGTGGFWDSLDSPNVFDPKVLYDPFANRWMFTAAADARLASSSVLIGVSQTTDPTGMWNLYRIDADADDTRWADFPSMGFNKDWIVVQVNMYLADDTFSGADIYVFDKANLYAGGAGLFTLLQDTSEATQVPAVTYDNSLATLYLVAARTRTRLRVSQITGAVGSEILTLGVAFPTSPDAWRFKLPKNSAPQLGSATGITTNDDRIQNVIYRNNALWAAHTIFLPFNNATRSAVQWWQFSPTGTVLQRGRVDDPGGMAIRASVPASSQARITLSARPAIP
jgi:hypothetical protein